MNSVKVKVKFILKIYLRIWPANNNLQGIWENSQIQESNKGVNKKLFQSYDTIFENHIRNAKIKNKIIK